MAGLPATAEYIVDQATTLSSLALPNNTGWRPLVSPVNDICSRSLSVSRWTEPDQRVSYQGQENSRRKITRLYMARRAFVSHLLAMVFRMASPTFYISSLNESARIIGRLTGVNDAFNNFKRQPGRCMRAT